MTIKWFESPEFVSQRESFDKILNESCDKDPVVAAKAQRAIAAALQTPLRSAVLAGDLISGIFNKESYNNKTSVEYPIDLIRPGSEGDFVAYTMPDHGAIPMRRVEGDRITVTTYRIANSIDAQARILRDANWNMLGRMMEVLEYGFIQKLNDDGFATLISSGVSRNALVYDADAAAGQFTPRLVSLMKTFIRRNGGGNSSSTNRGKLTDLYVSPECLDDVRSWTLNLVPDAVRTSVFYAKDGSSDILDIYGVKLHDLDELGVGQKYQLYYTSTLAKSLAASDTELVIGLDLSQRKSFVMPVGQELEITDDSARTHRQGLVSYYGSMEVGFGALDNRDVLLGSL